MMRPYVRPTRDKNMAELKTKKNRASVKAFIKGVESARRREDCAAVVAIMQDITGEKPAMWGTSIIGFGSYTYRYESGRSGDWPLTGVSPRKQSLTLYIMTGFDGSEALMKKLGKHKTGRSCLYINQLEDVHLPTLKALVRKSVNAMRKKYG